MKVVKPNTRCSLLLTKTFNTYGVCTARAAFKHLITKRVKGMDASGNIQSFDGTHPEEGYPQKTAPSEINWGNKNMVYYDDQPCLRSAPDRITGEEKFWPIPTIIICNFYFGYHRKQNEKVSLRKLYTRYKGICQICLEKKPMELMTKDHLYPRSKGGSNHDFNLVLACKSCNNKKGDISPYYNVKGEILKASKILPGHLLTLHEEDIRDEWKPFLFID